MPELLLILEDAAHEAFIRPLVGRLATQAGLELSLTVRSAQGGYARVLGQVKDYAREVDKGHAQLADGLLVAVDANCTGYLSRRDAVDKAAGRLQNFVIHAIPDPHIERWLLLDSEAFKQKVGKGCNAPDEKCMKDRYKQLLAKAVLNAGVQPLLGGIEYAEDLAMEYHEQRVADNDGSFRRFLEELRN